MENQPTRLAYVKNKIKDKLELVIAALIIFSIFLGLCVIGKHFL
jgi:hypothetical protein